MKKVITVLFAIVLVLSTMCLMCACGTTTKDYEGNVIEAEDGEIILQLDGDFVVSKLDKGDYYASSFGHKREYTAVLSNDEYSMLVIIESKQYVLWNNGDIVSGEMVSKYYSSAQRPSAHITIEEEEFDILWYGKY